MLLVVVPLGNFPPLEPSPSARLKACCCSTCGCSPRPNPVGGTQILLAKTTANATGSSFIYLPLNFRYPLKKKPAKSSCLNKKLALTSYVSQEVKNRFLRFFFDVFLAFFGKILELDRDETPKTPGWPEWWILKRLASFSYLGGGFEYFLFSPRKLGKIPILTNIFQLGWNHQLVILRFKLWFSFLCFLF